MQGKTLARILFYEALEERTKSLSGRALDLAGGPHPSYATLLPPSLELVRTDRIEAPGVQEVDMNAPLPFKEDAFDAVFLFNALYIVDEPEALAREVRRVLKPGGTWLVLSPFIANEMPSPHDYLRFTAEGLERLARRARFSGVHIERQGERASSATHLMHPFYRFNIVRALFFAKALLMDDFIPEHVRKEHPAPLQYFCTFAK